ncbi:hypothetical protein [Halobacillus naozhouensis]|uniref:Uncharacterized protein n=1 Tax=Halobacillus naozhouensis TaxID=554880 RepID=A0ABY8IXC2_9BACI|nr:hypothetical protein [Halobacillus naozhouensis]WFT74879.1 hypothetical protein P9989_00115 [Halobacillus naozhouensis]
MQRMKNYEITYEPKIKWAFRVINPYNEFDIRNMEETTLVPDWGTYVITVKAPNKTVAKAALCIDVFRANMGHGYGEELALSAVNGIKTIKEVRANVREESDS